MALLAYTVTFHKHLVDSTGHPHRCEQGCVVIDDARSREAAVLEAQARFAHGRGLDDWRCLADEMDVHHVEEGERLN